MKTITDHHINECNEAIAITADEPDPNNGNASHVYDLSIAGSNKLTTIAFQHGPIKEVGTNGLTHEALLAILIDRLNGFQSGPYACEENRQAAMHLMAARDALFARTRKRVERGVEGTHTV